jgi:hypothetical protein
MSQPINDRRPAEDDRPAVGDERPVTGATSAHPRDVAKHAEHQKIRDNVIPR